MVRLTIDDAGKRGSVDASADQPFWVADRHGAAPAQDIQPGENLRTRDGKPAKVIDIRSYTQVTQIYHLSPTDSNGFYVAAGDTAVLTLAAAKKADRFDYLNRDGYYSGMYGGDQTDAKVKYRHSQNRDRFDPDIDHYERLPENRTYGEARLLEHRLSEEHETYIGRDKKTYRGNRQRPLAPSSMPEYNGYEARLKQLRGGSCP
ncbi:hypothetical protein [Amycolatopsis sp. NPDC051071]|uniref:hypothetical protein n=1 Tax=Amycolatopsis sp. NPDC051071 TaxID=3154637 RepID=UPI00342DEEFF